MLPKLCHLDNDLVIIIIILQCICVVHMTYIPRPGIFFFSLYPSVALARNQGLFSFQNMYRRYRKVASIMII